VEKTDETGIATNEIVTVTTLETKTDIDIYATMDEALAFLEKEIEAFEKLFAELEKPHEPLEISEDITETATTPEPPKEKPAIKPKPLIIPSSPEPSLEHNGCKPEPSLELNGCKPRLLPKPSISPKPKILPKPLFCWTTTTGQ